MEYEIYEDEMLIGGFVEKSMAEYYVNLVDCGCDGDLVIKEKEEIECFGIYEGKDLYCVLMGENLVEYEVDLRVKEGDLEAELSVKKIKISVEVLAELNIKDFGG